MTWEWRLSKCSVFVRMLCTDCQMVDRYGPLSIWCGHDPVETFDRPMLVAFIYICLIADMYISITAMFTYIYTYHCTILHNFLSPSKYSVLLYAILHIFYLKPGSVQMNRNSVLSKIRYTCIESEFSKKIKLAILLPVH